MTSGEVTFNGHNLLELSPEERSWEGLFLSFQYPIEIPGVTNVNFMRTAVNEHRRHRGLEPLNAADFLKLMRSRMEIVEMNPSFSSRGVNVGFSGGEKKRNEIFQMAMLEPRLSILDETDSGLDVDALRIVATGVNKLRRPDNAAIVITHYQRLLDYIVPDVVHVLYKGRIIKTAGKELAKEATTGSSTVRRRTHGRQLYICSGSQYRRRIPLQSAAQGQSPDIHDRRRSPGYRKAP